MKILNTNDMDEKKRIEREIHNESKLLIKKLEEIR
jgi:hypothetical protein